MDRDEILVKVLIVVMIVLAIIVCVVAYQNVKSADDLKQSVSTTAKKIVDEVTFMEVEVGDVLEGELHNEPVVLVNDEESIDKMLNIINAGEKYEFKDPVGFDILPTAYLYKKGGEIITIAAIDEYVDEGEYSNYILYTTNKNDVKKVYRVEEKLGKYIEDLYDDNYKNGIMLYNGYEFSPKVGLQMVSDMPIGDETDERYNISYYNYEKNKKLKKSDGDFGEETYEGYSVVSDVEQVAFSKDMDVLPRQSKELKNLPTKIKEMKDKYSEVSIEEIDLDGDHSLEYVLSLKKVEDDGTISRIQLLDSNLNVIKTLATWDATDLEYEMEEDTIDLDNVMYFDFDDDGKMEILMDLPAYEGTLINIYRYDNHEVYGATDYNVTVEP